MYPDSIAFFFLSEKPTETMEESTLLYRGPVFVSIGDGGGVVHRGRIQGTTRTKNKDEFGGQVRGSSGGMTTKKKMTRRKRDVKRIYRGGGGEETLGWRKRGWTRFMCPGLHKVFFS